MKTQTVFLVLVAALVFTACNITQPATPQNPVHVQNHYEEIMWNHLHDYAFPNGDRLVTGKGQVIPYNGDDVVLQKEQVFPTLEVLTENCQNLDLTGETTLSLSEWSIDWQNEELWVTYQVLDPHDQVLATYEAIFNLHAPSADGLLISAQCG